VGVVLYAAFSMLRSAVVEKRVVTITQDIVPDSEPPML
jgi:hypothetical protein